VKSIEKYPTIHHTTILRKCLCFLSVFYATCKSARVVRAIQNCIDASNSSRNLCLCLFMESGTHFLSYLVFMYIRIGLTIYTNTVLLEDLELKPRTVATLPWHSDALTTRLDLIHKQYITRTQQYLTMGEEQIWVMLE
jgi:hypothetical protein